MCHLSVVGFTSLSFSYYYYFFFTLFQELNCSYLNPQILPFFNSPPHPTEAGGGRVSEQLLVFSCHLGLNNKKLLCCKTLQPLPVPLPLFRRRGVTAAGKRSRGKATVLEFSGQSLFFHQSQTVLELGEFASFSEGSPSLEQAQGCLDNPDTSCTSAQIRGLGLSGSLGLTCLPGMGIRMEV